MSLEALARAVSADFLEVFGHCAALPSDGVGDGTIVLFGPREPGFWGHFTESAEWQDGAPDPMDRWSERVISYAASKVGGQALFPFGDPVRPFFSWATRTGRAFSSPVAILVHDVAGLMVSYRGAVLLPEVIAPDAPRNPCDSCEAKPCLTACPVGALTGSGYDLPKCHAYLDTSEGKDCMANGCGVRLACPVSQNYGRVSDQSAYHMGRFHRTDANS